MTKTIARLEKDRAFLQAKCEQTDITLIEMAEEVCYLLLLFQLLKRKKFKFIVLNLFREIIKSENLKY